MTPESGPSIDAASAPLADAWSYNTNAVQDWIARQRALAAQRGLWDDETGLPTQAGMVNALQQWANGVQTGTIRAFHGSPYDFSAFDASKIGTGEGAQAYGHGLYFAGNENVARSYRDNIEPPVFSKELWAEHRAAYERWDDNPTPENQAKLDDVLAKLRAKQGHMYEVNLNVEPEHLLDLDKSLSEQTEAVKQALGRLGMSPSDIENGAYQNWLMKPGRIIAEGLKESGIPGAQYLDQGSRGAGDGTRNYVMFDPTLIEILRKYGIAGGMLGGTAALSESDKPSAESLTSPRDTNVLRSLAQ